MNSAKRPIILVTWPPRASAVSPALALSSFRSFTYGSWSIWMLTRCALSWSSGVSPAGQAVSQRLVSWGVLQTRTVAVRSMCVPRTLATMSAPPVRWAVTTPSWVTDTRSGSVDQYLIRFLISGVSSLSVSSLKRPVGLMTTLSPVFSNLMFRGLSSSPAIVAFSCVRSGPARVSAVGLPAWGGLSVGSGSSVGPGSFRSVGGLVSAVSPEAGRCFSDGVGWVSTVRPGSWRCSSGVAAGTLVVRLPAWSCLSGVVVGVSCPPQPAANAITARAVSQAAAVRSRFGCPCGVRAVLLFLIVSPGSGRGQAVPGAGSALPGIAVAVLRPGAALALPGISAGLGAG